MGKVKINGWVEDGMGNNRHYKNGLLHCLDGPAEILAGGSKFYYQNGKLHRLDGPAAIYSDGYEGYWIHGEYYKYNRKVKEMEVMKNGRIMDGIGRERNYKFHYKNDVLHCEDGPAVIGDDGSKLYYRHGKFHRIGGPAVIYSGGHEEYWVHGEQHRLDGPAIIHEGGYEAYAIHNLYYTKKEFDKKTRHTYVLNSIYSNGLDEELEQLFSSKSKKECKEFAKKNNPGMPLLKVKKYGIKFLFIEKWDRGIDEGN